MLHLPKNRWHAFAWHLAFSIAILIVLICLIAFYWYPGVYIDVGGWEGMKIAAAVDLLLGPILTLMVYNPLKKSIKWDMAFVFLMQFSCLTAGVWIIHNERPVAEVFSIDAVFVNTYKESKLVEGNLSATQLLHGSYPKRVYLELPDDYQESVLLEFSSLTNESAPLHLNQRYYQQYDQDSGNISDRHLKANFDENLQCYWLHFEATHYVGEACYSPNKGVKKIRRR